MDDDDRPVWGTVASPTNDSWPSPDGFWSSPDAEHWIPPTRVDLRPMLESNGGYVNYRFLATQRILTTTRPGFPEGAAEEYFHSQLLTATADKPSEVLDWMIAHRWADMVAATWHGENYPALGRVPKILLDAPPHVAAAWLAAAAHARAARQVCAARLSQTPCVELYTEQASNFQCGHEFLRHQINGTLTSRVVNREAEEFVTYLFPHLLGSHLTDPLMNPERALAYDCANVRAAEARVLEFGSGPSGPPSLSSLDMLAAFMKPHRG